MKNIKILSLILPIAILIGFVGLHTVNKNTGTSWVIDIEGYDPRDLLRGHYLTYRYAWNWDHSSSFCTGKECCLCLNQTATNGFKNPIATSMKCEQASQAGQCASHIRGQGMKYEPRFRIGHIKDSGLTRYYIPEKHAKNLDQMLRRNNNNHQFTVGLRVNNHGTAFIEDMYINDTPLSTWLDNYKAADK